MPRQPEGADLTSGRSIMDMVFVGVVELVVNCRLQLIFGLHDISAELANDAMSTAYTAPGPT